jgi:hypothetical protein
VRYYCEIYVNWREPVKPAIFHEITGRKSLKKSGNVEYGREKIGASEGSEGGCSRIFIFS